MNFIKYIKVIKQNADIIIKNSPFIINKIIYGGVFE